MDILQFNLTRITQISILTHLWNQHFSSIENTSCRNHLCNRLMHIRQRIFIQIENFPLPSTVTSSLKIILTYMYEKIFNWYQFTMSEFGLVYEPIFWSPMGYIQQETSFQHLSTIVRLDQRAAFINACHFCNIDVVQNLWNQFSDDCKAEYLSEDPYDDLILYWLCYLTNDFSPIDAELLRFSENREYAMLKISLSCQQYFAVKYFWSLLDETEKDEFVANEFFDRNIVVLHNDSLCLFFWQLISRANRGKANAFLLYIVGLTMAGTWPWDEHFPQFIETYQGKAPQLGNVWHCNYL